MAWMKTDNRMSPMFGRGGARNNARHVHKHFIAVNDCEAERCPERLSALELSSFTRVVARIARIVSCGETCIHQGLIVALGLHL